MIYSDKHKFIFIAVPKTGTCTIENILKQLIPNDIKCYLSNKKNKVGIHKHITAKDLKRILNSKKFRDYKKFAFVRNPYDRAVSWYTYVYRLNNKDNPELMNMKVYQSRSSYGLTFEEFIIKRKNVWAKKQINYLVDDNNKLLVDEVLRFEDFDNEVAKMLKYLNVTIKTIPKINQSQYRRILGKKYEEYCDSDKVKKIIYDELKDDFETFGYNKDF